MSQSPQNPLDKLNTLERRFRTLLNHLDRITSENEALSKQNAELKEKAAGLEILREQNDKLMAQIDKLQADVGGFGEREGQVKDRLQTILKKIDAMEEALEGKASR